MNRALMLMYHLVDAPRSERERRFCTAPADFERQISWLRETGYSPISLDQLCLSLQGKAKIPDRAVHITFDDGFPCVLEHAAPILQRHEFPATMFSLSDRLGGVNDWMTERGFPERTILSASGLLELTESGFAIGSHTRTHASLPNLPPERRKDEIVFSKQKLEDALGRQVDHFAYPFGHFTETVRDQVAEAGYLSACSTRSGFNRPGEDMFLLRRIDIFGTDKIWQFRQKVKFGTSVASFSYPLHYYARRFMDRLKV